MARRRKQTISEILEGVEDRLNSTIGDYVHNLLIGTRLRQLRNGDLMSLEDQQIVLAMAAACSPPASYDPDFKTERLAPALRRYFRRTGAARRPRAIPDPLGENLVVLARLLGLTELEREILTFLVCLQLDTELRSIADMLGDVCLALHARNLATAIMRPADQTMGALNDSGRLVGSGIVAISERGNFALSNQFDLKTGIVDLVLAPALDRDRVLDRFLPVAKAPTLCRDDFVHLEGPVRMVSDLLGAALEGHTRGVNVLFYGPTGTGKSELARLLAQDMRVKLYAAGMADAQGESAAPNERLASLLLGHRLIGTADALLLFDEVEDLFRWEGRNLFAMTKRSSAYMSKQWFNNLLENNPVPTIWISNVVDGIDEAFLRRFTYAIEFKPLGVAQRVRVLGRHLGSDSTLDSKDVEAIAQRHQVSPAQLATAVAGARMLAKNEPLKRTTIEKLLAPVEKLVTGKDPERRTVFEPRSYRIDVLNSPEDLAGIADSLASWTAGSGPGISLCLYGPPGTGKSEYVRYLAHRMGRRIVARRGSDLLSMWVGGTEKLIAEAFREAEEDDAVLLFDEVDSFLRDRSRANQSWELSQTNELLQQLETCHGVVACTTNLWGDLDLASLRRFVFKVEFKFMQPEQALTLFGTMFADLLAAPLSEIDMTRVRTDLARLTNLTPGDFAAVARRVRTLGGQLPADELCTLLRREVEAKGVAPRRAGF